MPLSRAFSEESSAEWVRAKDQQWVVSDNGPWAVLIDDEFAGWGGFQHEENGADFALVLLPEQWGHGAAVTRAALDRGFDELGFEDVIIALPFTREPTRAVARFGFVPDGEVRYGGALSAVSADPKGVGGSAAGPAMASLLITPYGIAGGEMSHRRRRVSSFTDVTKRTGEGDREEAQPVAVDPVALRLPRSKPGMPIRIKPRSKKSRSCSRPVALRRVCLVDDHEFGAALGFVVVELRVVSRDEYAFEVAAQPVDMEPDFEVQPAGGDRELRGVRRSPTVDQ